MNDSIRTITAEPKLNLVLCGRDGSLKASISELLRGSTSKSPTSHQKVSKVCVKKDAKAYGRQITVVELPALSSTDLSEEEVKRETLNCVSFCDPGVHAFLFICPVGPCTDEDKAEMEKIHRIFVPRERIILLLTTDTDGKPVTDFVKFERLIDHFGGRYRVLMDHGSSKQIPELLQYIESVKTDPYSLQTNMRDQEQRVRHEMERNHKKKLMKMEKPIKELQQMIPLETFKRSVKPKLNLVLCGRDGSLKASISELLRGSKSKSPTSHQKESKVCVKKEGKAYGRQITVVELPALSSSDLSEEEVKRETLNCVSFCDPGVHAFLFICPVGPCTDEDKAEIKKIQRIIDPREHIILLLTTDTVGKPVTDFVNFERLISLCEHRYRVLGLKDHGSSKQIPELLKYIDRMKTKPYSLKTYTKAQEQRVKCEIEKKQQMKMEKPIKELQQKIPLKSVEVQSDSLKSLRIVLIGKTGNGKSATGNTILGRNEFHSEANAGSVTNVCQKGFCKVDGKSVAVIDTPGLFDTTLTNEEVQEEISRCISLSAPGPHAFIIVLNIGRFTKEEMDTLDLIKKIFGPKAAQFSIVLFTRGDDLEDETIEDYVNRSNSAELKQLLSDSGNRFLAFNNKDRNNCTQVTQLLNMIEMMIKSNAGQYFTNSMFEEAEMSIKKRVEEILKEKEREIQAQKQELELKYNMEMEELKKKKKRLEEEKRNADLERVKTENMFKEKEEALRKEFEKEETEKKKQQKAEYQQKIQELKQEKKVGEREWEGQNREDSKRKEEVRKIQEKRTEDLEQEQEIKIRRAETEGEVRKENDHDEMKKAHEQKMKELMKNHEDEARKQAEVLNIFKTVNEKHIHEINKKLQEFQDENEKLKKENEELKNKPCYIL